ncbi:MAG TPA: cation transporter [Gemmatimonadaceae bacterium]|nr:cation transporter [Gemmatimonadaceae bacterium]
MKSIDLAISGMSCGHCVRAVSQALAEVPGVQVENVGIGSARIRAGDDPAVNAAIEAVRDAGYDAEVAARS